METFISITNDGIFTKKISRVIEPIWNLWWKFHQNSFVSYEDKNFQTFSLKSWTRSFEGCEIRNFINLALYCPWIILFYKGCYQTLSQKSKMQNSLFVISMKKFETFIFITNDGIFTKKLSSVIEPIWKLWWKFLWNSFVSYGDKIFETFSLKSRTMSVLMWNQEFHKSQKSNKIFDFVNNLLV